MRCPHCQVAINVGTDRTALGSDADGNWKTVTYVCPECERMTVQLIRFHHESIGGTGASRQVDDTIEIVRPRASIRPPAPRQVPEDLRQLYDEASTVAPASPRAAGALVRRALQQLIRDTAGISKRNLET